MRKTFLVVLVSIIASFVLSGQVVIDQKFYKNKYGGPPVDEKKAKFIELTIQDQDSTFRYEMRSIKDNELVQLKMYKDGLPVGKWIYTDGSSLDYDFALPYSTSQYTDIIHYSLAEKTTKQPVVGVFEAPVFPQDENNFPFFISKKLIYPQVATENGIQGKVVSQFIIDESGKLIELSILKSADKVLDKEAARVIRLSPDWKPATLNGQPVRVCITMPTIFRLQ